MSRKTEGQPPGRHSRERLLYEALYRVSPELLDLRRRLIHVERIHNKNQGIIERNADVEVTSYGLEDTEPDLRYYEVRLSRRGELFTADLVGHPHLTRRQEVPDALGLTAGDLDAAAQWSMLPQLATPTNKPAAQFETPARTLIDTIQYRTALRRLYVEKHIYDNQIWKAITENRVEPDALSDTAGSMVVTQPATPEMIEQYLSHRSVLAERIGFTVLARLGARAHPRLKVFQPSAGVDTYQKVDILVRLADVNQHTWIGGIDLTVSRDSEVIWGKELELRRQNNQSPPVMIKDPLTRRSLRLHREMVLWPQSDPAQVAKQWRQTRGSTMITPECVMSSDTRTRFAAALLRKVCGLSGERVYDDEAIIKSYQATYADYDRRTEAKIG